MKYHPAINDLKSRRLAVCYNSTGPYAGGYSIGKPEMIPGNRREGCRVYFQSEHTYCDTPILRLYPQQNMWIVQVNWLVPGPGPGDFKDRFTSLEDAANAVIDYFFGDPSKMNPPEILEVREARLKFEERDKVVSRLRAKRLLIVYSRTDCNITGYEISKPVTVPGNKRERFNTYHGRKPRYLSDAPIVFLYQNNDTWICKVDVSNPGDFEDQFESFEEAANAVIDYFFGDPSKMNPPELLEFQRARLENSWYYRCMKALNNWFS
jgi:hypothetical protein